MALHKATNLILLWVLRCSHVIQILWDCVDVDNLSIADKGDAYKGGLFSKICAEHFTVISTISLTCLPSSEVLNGFQHFKVQQTLNESVLIHWIQWAWVLKLILPKSTMNLSKIVCYGKPINKMQQNEIKWIGRSVYSERVRDYQFSGCEVTLKIEIVAQSKQ